MEEQIPQQAPVPESKYSPLNLQEFQELKEHLAGIKSFLPEHLMGNLWSKCNRIRGERTNQPCSCKSSAGLWGRCVDELRQFVRDRDAQ
jgi:hypothetical protein